MKNKIYTRLLVFLVLGLGSCQSFLEESSLDEVRPSTVNDLEQLMLGEAYLRSEFFFGYMDLLTDDVESNFPQDPGHVIRLEVGAPIFSWQADMFEQMKEKSFQNYNSWSILYQKIKGCNVVLDMLDKVTGDEASKLNQKGQALSLRAFYYFMLVNAYGQPYNAEGVDIHTSPGVPLILESTVKDEFPPRASVAAVYEQIVADLLVAAPLLDEYGQNNVKYKVTPLFVHTLFSRVYLYMEEWEKAIEQSSYVVEHSPFLLKLSNFISYEEDWFGEVTLTADRLNGGVFNSDSPEFIWGYSASREYEALFEAVDVFGAGGKASFQVSSDLINSHESLDLRPLFYYQSYFVSFFPMLLEPLKGLKCDLNKMSNTPKGMRAAESYLNRAEGYIRLYLKNGDDRLRVAALQDLNYLRKHRFAEPYVDKDIKDGQLLLEFCQQERRRELSFEDHRWFDLRRYGMPALKHELTQSEGQMRVILLPEKSLKYVLPIPREAMDKNPALKQNPQ